MPSSVWKWLVKSSAHRFLQMEPSVTSHGVDRGTKERSKKKEEKLEHVINIDFLSVRNWLRHKVLRFNIV